MVSQYDYAVNAIGQRTGVATNGTAFPAVPSWLWSYDALGQVTRADSSVATSDRAYQYDSIGNRQRAAAGTLDVNDPVATLYAASGLNQYSQITSNAITSTLVHDADGNTTVYPGETTSQLVPQGEQRTVLEKSFSWNAENQMVFSKSCSKSQIISPVVPGVPAPINPVAIGSDTAQTYYFYDSLGRRIAKKSGTTDNGMTIYIYDGWNCIAEYTQHSEGNFLKITRLWGIDLSDSLQGAGGVGGMLSESSLITSNPITFNSSYPTYDGNGNVSEYLSANGSIAAHFEYDPFGNTVVNTDTSNQFAYRFSTKPRDQETGLYYYGYRYYDPMTGRWPSRDPIEEQGGINLCGFVGNDGVAGQDYLGLYQVSFEIATTIRRTHGLTVPFFALGEKTRQWVTVETDTGAIVKRGNATGSTAGIPAVSDYFEQAWRNDSECKVKVTMTGYGQNLANLFLGAINWNFEFEIDLGTNAVKIKKGEHDGFPSYKVFYGPNLYEFDEITPDRLDEPMEIKIP